jgi:stage II sporulation protein D
MICRDRFALLRTNRTVRARFAFAGALLAALAGCAQPPPRTPALDRATLPDSVTVRSAGRVVSVPLEEYVLASVLSELTPINESAATMARAYEVQAVLARTYAVFSIGRHGADGFDLCDATHCQLYEPGRTKTSRFASAAREAVRRTEGVVLTYAGRPAETLFHSDCGGYTASADATWGGPAVPYLLSKPDDVPALTHRKWRFQVVADKLRLAFNADHESQVGRRLTGVEVRARDISGRAVRVVLSGEQSPALRGEDVRAIMNRAFGDTAIQSTRFSISRAGSAFLFEGTGFGHGVGLCQVGALARARRGEPVDRIFADYFPGALLTALRTKP